MIVNVILMRVTISLDTFRDVIFLNKHVLSTEITYAFPLFHLMKKRTDFKLDKYIIKKYILYFSKFWDGDFF